MTEPVETQKPARRKITKSDRKAVAHVFKELSGWREVAHFEGSQRRKDGSPVIHVVDRSDAGEYRCTCQGFKIHKRGFCKHTEQAQRERR